jgi:hypothetical protein
MSELSDLLSDTLDAARSAADYAERAKDLAVDVPDFDDLKSELQDAQEFLSRAQVDMPSRYTEVGDIPDMLDNVEYYLSDLESALDNIERALDDLS